MAVTTFFQRFAQLSIAPAESQFDELDRISKAKGWKKKTLIKRRGDLALATWKDRYAGLSELDALQSVCRDLGVNPVPASKKKCRQAIKVKHVNIYDFLNGNFKTFRSRQALSDYCFSSNKIFPLSKAKQYPILRAMLNDLGA